MTRIPVQNKGYNTEISAGTENLSASGIVTSKQIKVSYGTEEELKKEFSVGGSWPPAGNASFGGGQTNTQKWGWTLEDHSGNTSTPTSLSGSFTVTLKDTDVSGSQTAQPGAPCTTCPNCGRSVNSTTDHVKGTCPIGGTAAGCGQPVYNCTPEEALQDAWHQERSCTNGEKWNSPWWPLSCPAKFRHCNNGLCWYRWIESRGHSDGSVPNPPSNVTNAYAESHFVDTPPEEQTDGTDTTHACGVHESWQSGDHSAASCGISGHYNCDGSDHSLQASCTSTDSNGSSCTVTGFYACASPHTHTYPAVDITCSGCNRTYRSNASSRTLFSHQVRTCANSGWVTIDGERQRIRCGLSFRRCTNGNSQCRTGRAYCNDSNGDW